MSAIQILIAHALVTLPDSISERQRLLRSMLALINSKHPDFSRICTMLELLDRHEAEQTKLPLMSGLLPGNTPKKHDGDGHHGKKGDGK